MYFTVFLIQNPAKCLYNITETFLMLRVKKGPQELEDQIDLIDLVITSGDPVVKRIDE